MNTIKNSNNTSAKIAPTSSVLPITQDFLPAFILYGTDPETGFDILVWNEPGNMKGLITFVKDDNILVLSEYNGSSESYAFEFNLTEVKKLFENTDARILFYLLELIASQPICADELIEILYFLTSNEIEAEKIFRVFLKCSSGELEELLKIIKNRNIQKIVEEIEFLYNKYEDDEDNFSELMQ